jgi:hypothetical protein
MSEGDFYKSYDGGALVAHKSAFADVRIADRDKSAVADMLRVADRDKSAVADMLRVADRDKSVMTSQDANGFIGKSISLPSHWNRSENPMGGRRMMTNFSSPTDDAKLSLYDRGINVREQSAAYFNQLLADNKSISAPKVLLPQQIRNLTDVMGVSNAGDNQFTNGYAYPNPKSPAFHLSSAQLIPLNGRVALEVQGNYVTQSGKPGMQYQGIFVPSGANGASIKEFFLQTQTAESFAKHQKEYRTALKSIKW